MVEDPIITGRKRYIYNAVSEKYPEALTAVAQRYTELTDLEEVYKVVSSKPLIPDTVVKNILTTTSVDTKMGLSSDFKYAIENIGDFEKYILRYDEKDISVSRNVFCVIKGVIITGVTKIPERSTAAQRVLSVIFKLLSQGASLHDYKYIVSNPTPFEKVYWDIIEAFLSENEEVPKMNAAIITEKKLKPPKKLTGEKNKKEKSKTIKNLKERN